MYVCSIPVYPKKVKQGQDQDRQVKRKQKSERSERTYLKSQGFLHFSLYPVYGVHNLLFHNQVHSQKKPREK